MFHTDVALPSGLDKALPAIEPPDSYSVPALNLGSLGGLDLASPSKSGSLTSPRTSVNLSPGDRSSPSRCTALDDEAI